MNKIEDINYRKSAEPIPSAPKKSYAMKILIFSENLSKILANETRVILKIEKSKDGHNDEKNCISKVIDNGFLALQNFSGH